MLFHKMDMDKEEYSVAGHKKSSYEFRNCLILFVDQPGLEPGTSRL